MKTVKRTPLWIFCVCMLIGWSGSVAAEGCQPNGESNSAYSLKGQGNFACADLGMNTVSEFDPDIQGSEIVGWNTGSSEAQIDAIIIEPSSGKRCLVNYPQVFIEDTSLAAGNGLSAPNADTIDLAIGCQDLINPEPFMPPPTPISTVGEGCQGSICIPNSVTGECDVVPTVSVTAVQPDGTPAVCSGTAGDQAAQIQCNDTCVERTPPDDGTCIATQDGFFPIACSRCEPSAPGAELKYCWEYVDKSDGIVFKPAQTLYQEPGTTVYDGSTCYKTTVRIGGIAYTYTTCR